MGDAAFDTGARVRVMRFGGRTNPGTVVLDAGRRVKVKLDTGVVASFSRENVSPMTRPSRLPPLTANHARRLDDSGWAPARSAAAPNAVVPVPKAKRVRSRAYLDFVRAIRCCACFAPAPSDPHHYGERGMGQKTDDLRTVPLCRADHDAFHATGAVRGRSVEETRELFLETQVALLVRWHEERS